MLLTFSASLSCNSCRSLASGQIRVISLPHPHPLPPAPLGEGDPYGRKGARVKELPRSRKIIEGGRVGTCSVFSRGHQNPPLVHPSSKSRISKTANWRSSPPSPWLTVARW